MCNFEQSLEQNFDDQINNLKVERTLQDKVNIAFRFIIRRVKRKEQISKV